MNPPSYNVNSAVTIDDLLAGYQCFLLFDRSGSMSGSVSRKNFGRTRWQELREASRTICTAIDHIDPDGATVVFFNDDITTYDNQSADNVEELFKELHPNGATNLHEALDWTFKYIKREMIKTPTFKALVVVVTDGVPTQMTSDSNEQGRIARLIADFTNFMSDRNIKDEQMGVLLLQVGDDTGATAFLKFLDDNLILSVNAGGYGAKFDIVSTVNFADVENCGGIVQAFIKAFTS